MKKTGVTGLVIALLLCLALSGAGQEDAFPPLSTPVIEGIDVSSWQGEINWSQVAESGKRIVYIRASEGDGFVDPYFLRNIAGARGAGLDAGCYHFLTAATTDQAVAQARFFINTVNSAQAAPNCRPAMDFGGGANLTFQQFNAVAGAFLSEVERLTGVRPLIYTDASGARDRYDASLAVYPVWVANYGVESPEPNGKWAGWAGFQYSDRGRVTGISTNVDLDQFTKEVYAGAPLPTATPTPTVTPTPTATATPTSTPTATLTPCPTPSPSPTPTFCPTPTLPPCPTATPTPTPGAATQYHQLRKGQTLEEVAALYGVTAESIRADNLIPPGGASPGQVLRVKAGQAPRGPYASLYIAPWDTWPKSVARQFSVSLPALEGLNFFPVPGRVLKGQALRIPPRTGRAVISAPDTLLDFTYVASKGDFIERIAARFGIPGRDLLSFNGLTAGERIYPGQIIHLTAFGVGVDTPFYGAYVVQKGDSLSAIARRFHVSRTLLFERNDIPCRDLIFPGQVLVIPLE